MILRFIPNNLGGIVAIVFSILILLFLPFKKKNRFKGIRFTPLSKVLFVFLVGDFFIINLSRVATCRRTLYIDRTNSFVILFYLFFNLNRFNRKFGK